MKFENLILRGLFIATLLACGLAFIAMAHPVPQGEKLAAVGTATALLTAAPASCPLPADGVLCPLKPAG
jgi:hypothetical protein